MSAARNNVLDLVLGLLAALIVVFVLFMVSSTLDRIANLEKRVSAIEASK